MRRVFPINVAAGARVAVAMRLLHSTRILASAGQPSKFDERDIDASRLAHPFWDADDPYGVESGFDLMDEFGEGEGDTLCHVDAADKRLLRREVYNA